MKRQIKVGRRSFLKGMAGTAVPLSIPGLKAKAQSSPPPPQNLPTGHFGDINENTVFDVCIVGSGFAGSMLGDALVKPGVKTVILESGADPRAKSLDERIQQLETYRSSGPIEYPVISSRFRGLGGTSWYWGGMCPRLHPVDFEKSSYTPAGAAWPVSYKDLEPYYEKAEEALRVRGGKRSQYHPPSRRDYPIPPDRDISPLESLLKQVGIVISHVPFSTGKDHHLSFLHDHYGPFLLMTDSHLPAFRSSPFGTLISEVTVTRLVIDEAGCVTGAEIKDLDRNTKVVRARVYIVACGGLESPRLLLLSRSSGFPHGIGNNHDLVGRFFMEHRVQSIQAKVGIGWRSFSFYELRGQSHQFYEEFKNIGLGGIMLTFAFDRAVDRQEIRAWEFRKALNRISTRSLGIDVETEMKPSPENRVILDSEARDHFGNPGTNLFVRESEENIRTAARGKRIARKIFADLGAKEIGQSSGWGHHHMGTCRMGNNPRTSVVDSNLRVHSTTNLFVAGSSVFVTCGTANPTLTLTALTFRLADHLRLQLQNGSFQSFDETRRNALPEKVTR